MKRLKNKIIKRTLYRGCGCTIEHGLPQYPLLKRHGMAFIDFDNDYMYLAYVDSNGVFKRGKLKKVKASFAKALILAMIKIKATNLEEICKRR